MLEITKTVDQMKRGIASIKTRSVTLDTDIHEYGIQAMLHAREHGDTTFLSNLDKALGKSARRNAFRFWVTMHTPTLWNKVKKSDNTIIEGYKLLKERAEDSWLIGQADAVPFWEFTVEPEPKAYTVAQALASIKSVMTKLEAEKAAQGSEMPDLEKVNKLLDLVRPLVTKPTEEATKEDA